MRHTRVAGNVFDGLSCQAGVLAAVSIAPEPQQHCRAVVLQADLKGPFRLLCRASLVFLPCKTTTKSKPLNTPSSVSKSLQTDPHSDHR